VQNKTNSFVFYAECIVTSRFLSQSYEKSSEKPNLFGLFRAKVTSEQPKLRKVERKAK